MKRPLIVGAQKLYLRLNNSVAFAQELQKHLRDTYLDLDVAVCPSFINLAHVAAVLKGSRVQVGAQNVHQEQNGAFTGQVAIRELKDQNVTSVIVGHSELRRQQGETNDAVNEKIKTCLKNGVTPIACVGENRRDREENRSREVIRRDLKAMLKDISLEDFPVGDIVIAYEPVWAIRAGRNDTDTQPATADAANRMHELIRDVLTECYGSDIACEIRLIYGGSVGPANARDLLDEPLVDGLLVGTGSITLDSFLPILEACERAARGKKAREAEQVHGPNTRGARSC